MPDNDLSPEAAKLLAARQAAADELKAIDGNERAITDPGVIRLAHARLYEAGIMLRVMTGENITAAEFKSSADLVEAARTAAKAFPFIKLHIVSGVTGIFTCKHCHQRNEIENYEKPQAPSAPPVVIEGTVVPEPAATAGTRPALPAPKAKQDVKPEPRHTGSIHDQPGARIRVHHEPWRGHVGTVDNP